MDWRYLKDFKNLQQPYRSNYFIYRLMFFFKSNSLIKSCPKMSRQISEQNLLCYIQANKSVYELGLCLLQVKAKCLLEILFTSEHTVVCRALAV